MGKIGTLILIIGLFTISFAVSGYITYQTMRRKKTTALPKEDNIIDVEEEVSEKES